MTVQVKFDCSNDAFAADFEPELRRVMEQAVVGVMNCGVWQSSIPCDVTVTFEVPLRDINGNHIGKVEVIQ